MRWDATYFARIALDGYERSLSFRTAFFPLQALATSIFMPLTGGDAYIAGMVVANVSCFVALLGLASLTAREFDACTARRAMCYLALFPSALFLFAGYSESLFLALAIWCFVALRARVWWLAGVLGLLAALTRQIGVLLILPFAAEYVVAAGWRLRGLRKRALGRVDPGGTRPLYWLALADGRRSAGLYACAIELVPHPRAAMDDRATGC